jgi:hypothetical protein
VCLYKRLRTTHICRTYRHKICKLRSALHQLTALGTCRSILLQSEYPCKETKYASWIPVLHSEMNRWLVDYLKIMCHMEILFGFQWWCSWSDKEEEAMTCFSKQSRNIFCSLVLCVWISNYWFCKHNSCIKLYIILHSSFNFYDHGHVKYLQTLSTLMLLSLHSPIFTVWEAIRVIWQC